MKHRKDKVYKNSNRNRNSLQES